MLEQRGTLVEHGSSRTARWLRDRRRLALWIAILEGLLIVFHVIPWVLAVVIAVVVVGSYFWLGRRAPSATAREAWWIAAVSQALVALVPIFVIVVGTLALVAVGALAVVALILLLGDRR